MFPRKTKPLKPRSKPKAVQLYASFGFVARIIVSETRRVEIRAMIPNIIKLKYFGSINLNLNFSKKVGVRTFEVEFVVLLLLSPDDS